MSVWFEKPSDRERTAVDKELHTDRQGVDGGLDRIERLVVWDGIGGPREHHDPKLHTVQAVRLAGVAGQSARTYRNLANNTVTVFDRFQHDTDRGSVCW